MLKYDFLTRNFSVDLREQIISWIAEMITKEGEEEQRGEEWYERGLKMLGVGWRIAQRWGKEDRKDGDQSKLETLLDGRIRERGKKRMGGGKLDWIFCVCLWKN